MLRTLLCGCVMCNIFIISPVDAEEESKINRYSVQEARVHASNPSVKLILLITEMQDVNFPAFTERFVKLSLKQSFIRTSHQESTVL